MIWTPTKLDRNDLTNILTEDFLYERFRLLMINQFKWSGFGDWNIQERHIENYLFDNGYCCVFEDPKEGLMCLPCYGEGVNVYGDWVSYNVVGFNYTRNVPADKAVLIENNKLRMPTEKAVMHFVTRLYSLLRTMDMNVEQLKLQAVFTATDKNTLTVKKIIDDLNKYNWALITDNSMSLEDIFKVLPTGVKCLTPELTDRYNAVMNEALTYFGINNANTDKRERLITDEANANNQLIDSCAEMFLESRKRACEDINKMFGEKFGVNVSVELRNKKEGLNNAPNEPVTKSNTAE